MDVHSFSVPSRTVLACLLAVALGDPGWAQSRTQLTDERQRLEALAERAEDRILALQREADGLAEQERTLLGDLRRYEIDRQLKAEELARIDADLAETTRELADTAMQVAELEAAVVAQRPRVEQRLVALYKLGRPGYLRLLLGVDELSAVTRAYRVITLLAARDRQRLNEYRDTLASLHKTQIALEARQSHASSLQDEARRTRRALDQAIAAQASLIDSIDARRDLTAQLTGELQLAQGRLQASLAAYTTGPAPNAGPISLPLRPFQGELPWPLDDQLIASAEPLPTTSVRDGIEVGVAAGSAVTTIQGGRVAFAGVFTGFGNLVIVDHGGQAYSLYGYLASVDVEAGVEVGARQVLGRVGRSPTGAEALYFELRIDGIPVSPLEWLQRRTNR